MMDYRRMGNMELNLGNTTSSHHVRDVWGSPRWTVIRIQALALVAIILSFFLASFGSCRRWSNRWIVQKGFLAAHVLSLSLGTYSTGLMQSTSVKSEMYPVWTVSLFILFGSIDPVTAYNGLDYKGPLSKVVFGICLNCGYVLLMSIYTISSAVGNTAIGTLSVMTFIKGFHRSLALVQQSRMRKLVQNLESVEESNFLESHYLGEYNYDIFVVDISTDTKRIWDNVTFHDIELEVDLGEEKDVHQCQLIRSCYDVCVANALSHQLQGYFLWVRDAVPHPETLKHMIMTFGGYKWFLGVIETELAFLYDVFFTGNPFLYYYQAKAASLWALASFIGICFVAVAAAIPGTMTSHGSCSTKVVDTTTADLVITFGILVSVAMLQLLHLIRCWTSNWAKVAVACAYASQSGGSKDRGCWWTWWMILKTFVATSSNWFDMYHLWQDKIGQYLMLTTVDDYLMDLYYRTIRFLCPSRAVSMTFISNTSSGSVAETRNVSKLYRGGARLAKMLGLDYIRKVLWDLLGSDTS